MNLTTDPIVVYSTHCPACNMLINLLDKKEISHIVIDNEDEVMETASAAGIRSVPFCSVPGEEELKTYPEMINYINSL